MMHVMRFLAGLEDTKIQSQTTRTISAANCVAPKSSQVGLKWVGDL